MHNRPSRPTRLAAAILGLALGISFQTEARAQSPELEPIVVGEPVRLEIFPAQFELRGPRSRIQLVVTGIYANGETQDLTRAATFESSDPASVEVIDSVARPRANGTAVVRAKVGNWQAESTLTVTRQEQPEPVSFEFGALVAITKHGCNSGACHGSPSGKGGFRLSLRAFDPAVDQVTLVREDYGRRTNPLDPESSLLLLKPLMKVPHGGGLRMSNRDPGYAILRDWIAEGRQLDPPDRPRCVKLEVYPPSGRVMKRPAHTQQLCVLAHFADGTVRDVTELAVYSSSDEEVASVDANGHVVGLDRGESAIVVRYLEHIETCFLSFVKDIPGFAWQAPPVQNYIDEHVDAKLQSLRYLPSDVASDDEFLRRVYLDVIGIPPTVEEAQAFLADTAPDKRARLIDALLERPEYAKFWALKWGDVLRLTAGQVGGEGVHKYYRWLERAVADNMPYDQFARELLTATGSTLSNPPANFYRTSNDEFDCVETVSQVFLGARLQCAKCHNHPFERWTQDNYYGMAAFFNRVQRKKSPRDGELVIWTARAGEVTQPRTGKQMLPWVPEQGSLDKTAPDRRADFSEWLTSADNPYFARIQVNRIWSQLFGRGIVDPPDDFRDSNPPANADLLDALARDFVEHRFDCRHILRTILNSRTYQTTFRPNEWNQDDEKYFSHQQPRMLTAEQLLDAISYVTEVPESFAGLPPGTKATQLPAPDIIKHEFLKVFGQPERQTVCACERTSESNLGMAIQFFNGPLIYDKLRNGNNRFRRLASQGLDNPQIITQLYLSALSREPSPEELGAATRHIENKQVEVEQQRQQMTQQMAETTQQADAVRKTAGQRVMIKKLEQIPEALRADLQAALNLPADQRNDVQRYLADKLGALVAFTAEEAAAELNDAEKQSIAELDKQLEELKKNLPGEDAFRMIALEDICWAILNTNEFLFQH